MRGVFNKFPDFFVQAFKIVVDSWKFTRFLLYILWNDLPTFMISRSNEQLQQQLEYTLLKSDCHSWWISKMQSGHQDTLEERYAIKFFFKLGKNATETYEGSSGRDSSGRGQHSSNRVSGISTRTMHQSTTPSLSQTIWLRCASRQFLTLPIVQTMLPVTFAYSLSSEAVIMREVRRWKRLWRRSLTRSHKRTSIGPSRSCWNGRTSAL